MHRIVAALIAAPAVALAAHAKTYLSSGGQSLDRPHALVRYPIQRGAPAAGTLSSSARAGRTLVPSASPAWRMARVASQAYD